MGCDLFDDRGVYWRGRTYSLSGCVNNFIRCGERIYTFGHESVSGSSCRIYHGRYPAATISSSDSYLLIAASAFAKNIYQGLFRKKASDKEVLNISRITLLLIAVVAIVIALDENSVIFTIVSFAWAGFGATFGPLMLFSLFWKRITRAGAIAGMISGGVMVFVWNLLVRPLGGLWDIYELLPAFLISCVVIVVVSLLTPEPSKEIQREFEEVRG